jgi:hypothetical protein
VGSTSEDLHAVIAVFSRLAGAQVGEAKGRQHSEINWQSRDFARFLIRIEQKDANRDHIFGSIRLVKPQG